MKSFNFKKNKSADVEKNQQDYTNVKPEEFVKESKAEDIHSFSKNNFLKRIGSIALKAGDELVEKALYLYYAAINKNTPGWARKVIYGALAYLVLPIDAIPDFIPVLGFTDDLGVISTALVTIAMYVTPEVKQQALTTKEKWFSKFRK